MTTLVSWSQNRPKWVKNQIPPKSNSNKYYYFIGKGEEYKNAILDAYDKMSEQYGKNFYASTLTFRKKINTGNANVRELSKQQILEVEGSKYKVYPVDEYNDIKRGWHYVLLAIER